MALRVATVLLSPCIPIAPCCLAGPLVASCRIYFNPEGGKPGILGRRVDVDAAEFPADWFEVGICKIGYLEA
jgi:hypothetical protein